MSGAGTPSTERGAWRCYRCGFRGFWSGGPHDCEAAGLVPRVPRLTERQPRTCRRCAYWTETLMRVSDVGECSRIVQRHWGECGTEQFTDTREASKISEPGSDASLLTGADFGCVLHIVRA